MFPVSKKIYEMLCDLQKHRRETTIIEIIYRKKTSHNCKRIFNFRKMYLIYNYILLYPTIYL